MFKRFLFLFACTTGGIGAAMFFFWQQATQLPPRDKNPTTVNALHLTDKTQIKQAREQVLHKVSNHLKDSLFRGEVQLDAHEVNALVDGEIAKTSNKSRLAQAISDTNTQIKDGKISVGAVVDLKKIPLKELHTEKQGAIAQLLKIPVIKEHPVYIELEGKLTIRHRKVNLDNTTRVKLGNFNFTLAEISEYLGIPQERLNQQISKELKTLPPEVEGAEIVGNAVVLRLRRGVVSGT
ncbi:MAG: hypothetical protein PUP92_05915 [Rhizonema sp. PD38]|nr:hypothetical protein [Rhizonema sp. PD38]